MFKELFTEGKQPSIRDMEKLLKKNGEIPIIITGTDTWGNIDDIENGIGYGINQFDDDFEIDLKKEKFELSEATIENAIPRYVSKDLAHAINDYADAVQADCDKAQAGHTYTVKYNKAYAAILWNDGEWAHSFVVISNSSNKSARFGIGDIMKAGTSKTAPTGKKTFGNVLQGGYKVKWAGY